LKEAGNINKSLMVLGQCMEVLRKNQEREKGRKVGCLRVGRLERGC
jgi:kinesin family protein 20